MPALVTLVRFQGHTSGVGTIKTKVVFSWEVFIHLKFELKLYDCFECDREYTEHFVLLVSDWIDANMWPAPMNLMKGVYKVAGVDTSYSQRREGQSLCPPLDSDTSTNYNFSVCWDTGLIQLSNETAFCVLPYYDNSSKVIKSTLDPFFESIHDMMYVSNFCGVTGWLSG